MPTRSLLRLAFVGASFALFDSPGVDGSTHQVGAQPRVDQFGAPLPKDALLRIGAMRFGVEGNVSSVAFSPDGKWLAAGDSYGLVYLWEAFTGKVVRQIGTSECASVVFFSRDSKSLGARTEVGEVRLWDIVSGKLAAYFQRKSEWQGDEQFLVCPDRSRLLVVRDGNSLISVKKEKYAESFIGFDKLPELSIDLLEMPSGKLVKRLAKSASDTVFSDAALSPDGKILAVGIRAYKAPRKLVHLLDATSGAIIRQIEDEGEGWYLSLAFSHDGKMLALGGRDEIALADVATGKLVVRLTDKMSTVGFLGFSADAKTLVSHSHDNMVRLWDLATKKVLKQFGAEATGQIAFEPLGGFGQPPQKFEHFRKAYGTALSPDGKVAAVGAPHCVLLWDVPAGKQLFPDQKPGHDYCHATFSPDGRLILIDNDKNPCLYDSETGEIRKNLPANIAQGVFSPEGNRLAFARTRVAKDSKAPEVCILNIGDGKELWLELPQKPGFEIWKLSFAPDSKSLLTLSTHRGELGQQDVATVCRWDSGTGKLRGALSRDKTFAWPSAFAPDGRTAAIFLGTSLLLTDIENDDDIWTREDGASEGKSGYPVFSLDGGFLFAWAPVGYVAVWEIATRSVIARVGLRPDGNVLFAKWHAQGSASDLADFGKHTSISAFAVSPDGRFVATSERFRHPLGPESKANNSPFVRIWEAATGKEVQRMSGFRSECWSLAFSPDGSRLASSFSGDTVLVWDLSPSVRLEGKRKKLAPEQMEQLWSDLASPDGAKAYPAMIAFQEASAEEIDFIAKKVRPAAATDAKRVDLLIKGLNSDRFAEREASVKELKTFAEQFRNTLRKALKEPASLEAKMRLERILADAPRQLPSESLRTLRTVQTLERIGTTEASRVLHTIADGAPEAHETIAAQTALQRVTMRLKNAP